MYISLSLMFACGFAAAICTLGVIAAAIIYFRRKKPKTVPFFIGAAVCLVAELIFSKLLLAWVTSRGSYAEIFDTTGKTLLLYSLPAAFFTELFRFFAVKFLHKKRQGHSGARSLGVGSGLCGVFVVVGLFALSNFIMMLLLHTGSFYDTVYPHIGDAEMSAVRAQMDSFTPASFICKSARW